MRNIIHLIFIAVVITLAPSCVNSSSHTLPPLQIEIPDELKSNNEIIEFIENAEDAINKYSKTAEELAKDCKQFAGKNEKDLSVFDRVKMVTVLSQFTTNFVEVADQYNKMIEQTEVLEEELNYDEALALATVMDAFKIRMEQLEDKYKDYTTEIK